MNALRFEQHLKLKEVGPKGQNKLKNSKVLVVGVGGLGCPVALYLTASGIGRFGLIDNDLVSLENLNRQILFNPSDIKKNKAVIAEKKLKAFSKETRFKVYKERLTADNAKDIIKLYDVVLDCSDNFATKYIVSDTCYKLKKPLITASVTKFEAQFMCIQNPGPCLRCVYPEEPSLAIPNCAENGVLGAFTGLVGSMQALLCIQKIVDSNSWKPSQNTFYYFNSKTFTLRNFKIEKRISCLCGKKKVHKHPFTSKEFLKYIKNRSYYFIDVREKKEIRDHKKPHLNSFPLSRIEKGKVPRIPKEKTTVILVCEQGLRSKKALGILKSSLASFKLLHLEGGMRSVPTKRVTL